MQRSCSFHTSGAPRSRIALIMASTVMLLCLDWYAGPRIAVSNIASLPVLWAAWHGRRTLAASSAVVLLAGHVAFAIFSWHTDPVWVTALNTSIGAAVLLLLVLITSRLCPPPRRVVHLSAPTLPVADAALVELDALGRIQEWPAAAARMFGYHADAVLGQPITVLAPPDQAHAVDDLLTAARTGAFLAPYNTLGWHTDGQLLAIVVAGVPVQDAVGVQSGLIVLIRDTTTQQQAAGQLRAAELKYRTLIEQLPAVTYTVEFSGVPHVSYISPQIAHLLGYTPAEWLADQTLWHASIHPADRGWVEEQFWQNAYEPTALDAVYRLLARDQRLVWVHHRVSAILALPGQAPFSIGTVFDITARKHAEAEQQQIAAQLQQTQKLESLGVLAGGIAHDFNNLLTSIQGYADLALRELPAHDPVRPLLVQVLHGGHRAAELVAQLLAYAGRGRFTVVPLNLSALIQDMAPLLDVAVVTKGLLTYSLRLALPSVQADATQLRQVVMNLVMNAAEATGDPGGIITVTTGVRYHDRTNRHASVLTADVPTGWYVVLEVADTGTGMDAATQARIFEPFYTTKFTGRGLGLAAVLGIVHGHHGALTVTSALGVGTTISVLFPVVDAPARPVAAPSPTSMPWQGSGRILIIDDAAAIRDLAQAICTQLGFTVRTAADGATGVALLRQDPTAVRVVLLDLTMPHMDGIATFHALRHIRSDLPIILTSGYDAQTALDQVAGAHQAVFLPKPYQVIDLHARLRQVLDPTWRADA